jgi:hypothetical protein
MLQNAESVKGTKVYNISRSVYTGSPVSVSDEKIDLDTPNSC